jgi:hypothetical protein
MSNNSATGGYLAPASSPAPLEGKALFEFLQQVFVNITGMPGTVFFPRWQLEPPNLPAVGSDWAAFGIVKRSNPKFQFVTATSTYSEYQTHEEMEILTSFYGPNADTNAALLRDGLYISQNREVLLTNNMGLVDTGDLITTSELVKNQWLYRVDLRVNIRRQIVRQYPILDVTSAEGTVYTDEPTLTIPIAVTGP